MLASPTDSSSEPAHADLLTASALVGLKLAVSAALVLSGFHAISDDDFARVAIAQSFADSPRLDPSGSSWLPVPFWLMGAPMLVLGKGWGSARGVSLLMGCFAVLSVAGAARWWGLPRRQAITAAAMAAVFPYSAYLGASVAPSLFCGGLLLVAISSLSVQNTKPRLLGAGCLLLATLSRYEAWPIAGVFAIYCLLDGARGGLSRRTVAISVALALIGPLLWMLGGQLHHGHPLFFIQRVTDYRQALGLPTNPIWQTLLAVPKRLLLTEPELTWLALGCLLSGGPKLRSSGEMSDGTRRSLVASMALLGFLITGELGDGTATHHAERPLLVLWLLLCVILARQLHVHDWSRRRWLLPTVLSAALGLRFGLPTREDFIDRRAEINIGELAGKRATEGSVVIDTPDFSYFAIQVGMAGSTASTSLDSHDPRKDRSDATADTASLERSLRQQGAAWLITTHAHAPMAASLGTTAGSNSRYVLIQLAYKPSSTTR